MKKRIKITVDIIMFILFLYLMAYRQMWQLKLHGYVGTALCILFIIHNLLNMNFYKTLFKGKYSGKRIFLTIMNLLLLIAMIGMIVSGILLSGTVYSFSQFRMTEFARGLHTISTSWGFVFMSLHLGYHLVSVISKVNKKMKNTSFEYVWYLILILVLVYGIYSFMTSDLLGNMFLRTNEEISIDNNLIMFYINYVAIVLGFGIIQYGINNIKLKKSNL